MPKSNDTVLNFVVFSLLVAIGVAGRWGQPDWCITPLAATGLMAGYWFRNPLVAVMVPITAMLISDLMLPGYDSYAVLVTVYLALGMSAIFGRTMRWELSSRLAGLARLISCSLAPAMLFFITTNFAVWASSERYAKTLAGITECYVAALPFARRMLAGDMAFVALLFGAAAVAGVYSFRGIKQSSKNRVAETA